MRNRLLIFGASTIVILGILIAAYFFFSDSADLTVETGDPFGGLESDFMGESLDEAGSGAGTQVAPRLIRVTDRPVAEGVVAITRTSTTTVPTETASGTPTVVETTVTDTEVRFIDRASGNIYRYLAHERSLTRLSNKTLPGIQRASWLPDGSVAYAQFLGGIGASEYVATYVLPDTGEGGFFLEQNLASAKAVGTTQLFTMLSGTTGSVGSVAKSDGTGGRTLFSSLLSALTVHPTSGSFYAYTKPSNALDGYAFQVNATSGSFTRILGPFRGLAALPNPDGTMLLYSYVERGTLRLAALNVVTRTVTPLPVATLAEKCVWAPGGQSAYCGVPTSQPRNLPDAWYQGAAVFSDRLWKIDMATRLATLVVDPSALAEVSIDAVSLATDPDEDILFFTDKHDGSLWAYDL